jgi:TRAP-type C4-dicarboxylate transport system permease small subunit
VVADGIIEKMSLVLSQAALIVMIVVIAVDIATRSLLNYSFEVADELGGYMLVAVAFLGLAVCQSNDGFHRVTFLQDLLSPRARAMSRIVFDVVTIALVLLLLVHFWKFAAASRTFGAVAPTYLATPLWLPQSAMALGAIGFIVALARTISRNIRILRLSAKD